MRFSISQRLVLVLGLVAGSLLLAGQLLAQTPDSTSPPPDPQTQCTTASGKWCLNSDGASGWCSYGSAACPAYDSASCSAQGGEWCASSGGGSGWCNSMPGSCPINDQATCTAKGRNWCTPQSGGSGWCTASATEKCPAYTEADCTAQSRTWCVSPGTASTSGWCTDSCPYSPTPTVDPQTQCTTASGKWCLNSDGASGYCSYGSSACPAYNAADCSSQGGDWCTYTSGGGGYCNSMPNSCPVNDKATCEAKSRKWCASSSGGGWCAMSNETCPTATPTTPTTPDYSAWPTTESDCSLYSGLWCKSTGGYTTYSGSCMMAGNTCPTTPKSGYMTCWDNTEVPNTSSCPVSPSNEADCTKMSKYWCKSAAASTYTAPSMSSGWCQGNPCSLNPPAGQMTCPDGKTFAANISGCPKKATPPTIVPEPVTVLCPDGVTKVVVGGTCPRITYTCPNGTVVKTADQCPKSEDEVSTCLKKGGVWCKDPSGVKSGYCAAQAAECKITYPPQPVLIPPEQIKPIPVQQEEPVSAREVKQDQRNLLQELKNMERFFKPLKEATILARIAVMKEKVNKLAVTSRTAYNEERRIIQDEMEGLRMQVERQNLLQELKNMERVFKSLKDETMLVKIATMRDEISKMTVADPLNRKEEMSAIYDEMQDLRYAMQDAQESGAVIEPERDKKFQEQALRDMKKSVKSFERFLVTFESKIKKVEKQGIVVDQSIKDIVIKAKDLTARAKEAKTYDEAREIMDQLPGLGDELNEALPRLEQLIRLPEALKVINRRVAEVERAIKTAAATAKRLKIDAADEIQKMQSLLAEAKEATAKLKTGSVEDADTFFDYIQESIMEKLDEALTTSQMIQTVANVKKYVNKVAADLKRFERRIVQLEKKGEDMSEARALLDEAKTYLEALRVAAARKLNADVADEIIEDLGSLFSLDDQLEEVLKLTAPDALEKQLRRLFEGSPKEQLKSFEVGVMEKTIVKAYQTANFFRLTPARSMAIVAE